MAKVIFLKFSIKIQPREETKQFSVCMVKISETKEQLRKAVMQL